VAFIPNGMLLVPAVQKNAAAKLNVIYQNLEYLELGETRIRRADLTAFIVAVLVEGRTYVGVGKTKKEARCEAAEKALRHLRLWTISDEENKRMMLYGIDEEDPVDVVNRLRAAAGLPPYSAESDASVDAGPTSLWENSHLPVSWDDGYSNTFNGRGPPPAHFHGPDFRPPMFPARARFNNGLPVPRPRGPDPSAFGRGYSGGRPIRATGFGRGGPNLESFNEGQSRLGPSQASFGRGYDRSLASQPPSSRGITSIAQRIPGKQDGYVRMENKPVPPSTAVSERVGQFRPPMRNRVENTIRTPNWPQEKPVVRTSNPASIRTRPDGSFTGPTQSSSNRGHSSQAGPNQASLGRGRDLGSVSQPPRQRPPAPSQITAPMMRNTAPQTQTKAVTNVSFVPGSGSAVNASLPGSSHWNPVSTPLFYGQQSTTTVTTRPRAAVPVSSQWNPGSASQLYGQQPTPVVAMPSYANTAVTTTTAANVTSINLNSAYPVTTQPQVADYLAYYNSYLQSMGITDPNSYVNVPVSSTAPAANPPTFPSAVLSDAAYASQAVAYANEAAAYYSAIYGLGSYADPSQGQLYNYLYSYDNSKPA